MNPYSDLPLWVWEIDPYPGADLRWPLLLLQGVLDLVGERPFEVVDLVTGARLDGPMSRPWAELVAARLARRSRP